MIGKVRQMAKSLNNKKKKAKGTKQPYSKTAGLLTAVIILAVAVFGIYTVFLHPSDSRRVIVLDPVHGKDDYALQGIVAEDAFSRKLCDEIQTQLKASGRYNVIETHDADTMMSVKERADVINSSGGDLLISIACRNGSLTPADGPVIFADKPSSGNHSKSIAFAGSLRQVFQDAGLNGSVSYLYYHKLANGRDSERIVDGSDTTDYGEETLGILEQTDIPGVVVRQIDVNSQTDVDAYTTDEGCKQLAALYVKAIDSYFGAGNE